MKYKLVMVQKLGATEDELNALSKKGYRIVNGPVVVIGGKSFLVMQKEASSSKPKKKKIAEEAPLELTGTPLFTEAPTTAIDPPVEKTSEDSSEVK